MMNVGDLQEQFQIKREQYSGVSIDKTIQVSYIRKLQNSNQIFVKTFTANTTFSSTYSINGS